MTATVLKRVFRLSSLELTDPAPDLPADEAIKLYAPSYPQLEIATLGEPFIENGVQIYEVAKNEVKTKG
jgi:PRTRC genetic system protein C